jgi:hypothetical protein
MTTHETQMRLLITHVLLPVFWISFMTLPATQPVITLSNCGMVCDDKPEEIWE